MSKPIRVLILEDRPDDVELMVRELRRAGFEPTWQRVDTQADYLAALNASVDIILSDFNLPTYDALQALRHLQDGNLDIPFIVVTGDERAAECIKRGAADYLLKDRLTRLGPAVSQALEQRQLRLAKSRAEAALRQQEQQLPAPV